MEAKEATVVALQPEQFAALLSSLERLTAELELLAIRLMGAGGKG